MKVSIIIPVYNAEKYLRQCLDSLVNQTLDDYEIILINDGSKDSSEAIIQEYKARFPERINAVTVENGGQGRARNIGMELARGEYLGFVDSDDWVAEDMFESMYLAAVESDADICVCDAVECHEDGSRTYLPMSACEEPARMTTAVWNKLFKKSTLGHLRFPEGLWYEDLAFVIKALFSSGEPARLSRGLYFYRVGQVSTMNNNNARKNLNIISIVDGLKDFLIPQEKIEDYFATLYAQKYEMSFRLYFSDTKPRMAIFVSKMSHCLFDLLARYTAGEWNVEIPLIISNHPDMQHVAERFGIPFYLFPITKETKEEQEQKEMELLAKHRITFIVLARYMQVISEQMINAYPNRIINIHHSFLPAFVGAKPYHAAFERGVKIIGATSHYVTTELDAGPIIEQDVVRITHKDTVSDLVNKGKDLEKIVLSRAVQKHIERKVLAYKNKTVIFN